MKFVQNTPIATICRNPNQMDLFAVGEDGRVYSAWWNGEWHDWFPIGDRVFAQNTPIAAISRNDDQMDLFAVGEDGRVYSAWWNGEWKPWFTIGDRVFAQNTPIAAISRNDDQMDLFAVGLDGKVQSVWWNGEWKPWFTIGSHMFAQNTPIAAISRNDDQMDLFAVHVVAKVYSASWNGNWRDWFLVGRKEEKSDYLLDLTAIDGTPAHAFASHKVRASSIARQFALDNPLQIESNTATEDNTIQLIAHLQAGSDDPSFSCPGQEPSVILAPKMLRNLNKGEGDGAVGTTVDEEDLTFLGVGLRIKGRPGDYDAALKGLVVIAYRYRHLLTKDDLNFILDSLVPSNLPGAEVSSFEKYSLDIRPTTPILTLPVGLSPDVPETENHMLLIGSTVYLVNQLWWDRTGDEKYNNNKENGVTKWLLRYMHTIAKHDFLEFNARPYQRYSLHALLNLHEFARDKSIRDAAQILLDYTMVKFAVSSNRQRRICPFRRLKENTNSPTIHNDLLAAGVKGNDAVVAFFLMYAGPTDPNGKPTNRFPTVRGAEALIAGLATYRPPPAAYVFALKRDIPAFQHRFYHGARPPLPEGEQADGGVEIYYKSPSFLLTAGGMFLNSGYGKDEFTKYKQTAIAQSTTLIPTRADVKFADLIRFDPYPDERHAINTGVHMGFACGANLRVPDMWLTLSGTTWEGNWLFLNLNREIPESNPLGFYVAAYRTPAASAEILDPPPESLGFIYAMELPLGSTMSFEEFKNLTHVRNTALPSELDIGGVHDFHSADNKDFRFVLGQITTSKYSPRVFSLSEANPVTDFTSLPLVEGPYLKSPGHDGLIEIRYPDPDCNTPLVLNYTDPLNPFRLDNELACSKPWIERSQALQQVAKQLLSLSQQLVNEGKQVDAIMAVQAAVEVLRPFQPPDPERASYLNLLAGSLWTLVLRLIEAQRVSEVSAPASESIQVYRQAAAAGAEVTGIANNLLTLSSWLANAGLTAEADAAADAAADILP